MRKIKLAGRLPLNMDSDTRSSLDQLFRECEGQINELIDYVMPRAAHSSVVTADTLVRTGKAVYRGFAVSVVTATGTIDVRDGVAAGGGVVIDTLPIATAVGAGEERTVGVVCETGIFVDYNGGATGSVTIFYEPLV